MSGRLRLSLSCWDYDRTRALQDGRVVPQGIELVYLPNAPEETFFRMLRGREFDVAEMSLSSYVMTLADDEPPFVALPVFPSRCFRHGSVYLRPDSPVGDPADLLGATVGVPEYQMTASVWIRGTLAEHHDLPVSSVRYRTGGLHQTGRSEKLALHLPADVDVAPIGPDDTLDRMLAEGRIDALYTARAPRSLGEDVGVRRLFPDPPAAEQRYFEATGVFPVMHVVVVRRDVHERHPWVARSLTDAFEAARRLAHDRLFETTALTSMLPWSVAEAERTRAVMGEDFWSYGLEPNRVTLETFLRYSHEQGLARRLFAAEELFAPETLADHRI